MPALDPDSPKDRSVIRREIAASAALVESEQRMLRIEVQQAVHVEQISAMRQAIDRLGASSEALVGRLDKLSLRLVVGMVVIAAGTDNGGEMLKTGVELVLR